ncbi:transposase [Stieleria varia]|uniref:transposase n=1 Tax=Stieleria varia TaxID=2528005 RepID=UPI001E589C26|nr:transposase [Stieleria varia]
MPNHTHLLVAFPNDQEMLRQCESWKRFSARRINALLEQTGRLWMQDGFDHLVRSLEQFEHFRNYIANNPTKANLQPGEWIHYQKDLGSKC